MRTETNFSFLFQVGMVVSCLTGSSMRMLVGSFLAQLEWRMKIQMSFLSLMIKTEVQLNKSLRLELKNLPIQAHSGQSSSFQSACCCSFFLQFTSCAEDQELKLRRRKRKQKAKLRTSQKSIQILILLKMEMIFVLKAQSPNIQRNLTRKQTTQMTFTQLTGSNSLEPKSRSTPKSSCQIFNKHWKISEQKAL